jgi:epoxyqueuosine reductase
MHDYDFFQTLTNNIKTWSHELGFDGIGISDTSLEGYREKLQRWLANDYHGDMGWMADHGDKRYTPANLLPGTARVISVRMNYLPQDSQHIKLLGAPTKAYIARYAMGRDYHKLMRKRLANLVIKINAEVALAGLQTPIQRAFVDSAPVMERAFAEKSGLGWIGKNTMVIERSAGSWFFLGEIFTGLPLISDIIKSENHCGSCTACLKVCPTDAFPQPYVLDARRCISYLTIENKGPIPLEFREAIGNRVFGCDDCQAICPWNKYAHTSTEPDFSPRHQLDDCDLISLFLWDEEAFLTNTEGSAIRRIGYQGWQRNLAIGLGNAPSSAAIIEALKCRRTTASELVIEHIDWAIQQQEKPNRRRQRKIKRL